MAQINRPPWKTLSLTRRDHLKEEGRNAPGALFRSPSIYDQDSQEEGRSSSSVMSSYLSGKICPLTPSQRQTDISHLVNQELKERFSTSPPPMPSSAAKEDVPHHQSSSSGGEVVPAGFFSSPSKGFCSIM